MTLIELFLPLTNQEFPAKVAFVSIDGEIKTIPLKNIVEYSTMYKFTGKLTLEQLPILESI